MNMKRLPFHNHRGTNDLVRSYNSDKIIFLQCCVLLGFSTAKVISRMKIPLKVCDWVWWITEFCNTAFEETQTFITQFRLWWNVHLNVQPDNTGVAEQTKMIHVTLNYPGCGPLKEMYAVFKISASNVIRFRCIYLSSCNHSWHLNLESTNSQWNLVCFVFRFAAFVLVAEESQLSLSRSNEERVFVTVGLGSTVKSLI